MGSNFVRKKVLERFRNGEHLCIAAAAVGCIEPNVNFLRGNMLISYKCDSPDEISAWKMRGTVGRNAGREHIAGDSTDVETEKQNIQQQYLMAQALEDISNQNIARDIAIAEKNIFETEKIERMAVKFKKRKGNFSVHCKYCGVVITDGNLMRHLNKTFYFVCDKQVLARVVRGPTSRQILLNIYGFRKLATAYGLECRHNWGSIFMFNESEFLALAQDSVKIFDRQAGKFIDCRKWSDLVFEIEQMSDDDLQSYKK